MPQMYPMNWFLFSLVILILMSLSSQSKTYFPKSSQNSKKVLFYKSIKWNW